MISSLHSDRSDNMQRDSAAVFGRRVCSCPPKNALIAALLLSARKLVELKPLDFLRRPVTGQVCDSCSSVADLNETRIAEIIAQQLQESRTCPRARTPEVCLAVCICLCVFLLILRIVIGSATRVQVSTRSVRTGSARNSIIALQWEAGRKRFARLLIMLSLSLADEHSYSCELPPTLLYRTVTSGRFATLKFRSWSVLHTQSFAFCSTPRRCQLTDRFASPLAR